MLLLKGFVSKLFCGAEALTDLFTLVPCVEDVCLLAFRNLNAKSLLDSAAITQVVSVFFDNFVDGSIISLTVQEMQSPV